MRTAAPTVGSPKSRISARSGVTVSALLFLHDVQLRSLPSRAFLLFRFSRLLALERFCGEGRRLFDQPCEVIEIAGLPLRGRVTRFALDEAGLLHLRDAPLHRLP